MKCTPATPCSLLALSGVKSALRELFRMFLQNEFPYVNLLYGDIICFIGRLTNDGFIQLDGLKRYF